jgi:DNA-binding GntR family transcriptional regulator
MTGLLKREIKAPHINHDALADMLTAKIVGGEYPVGERFPTEFELQERFGVGRHTIREALKILTEKGLLGRRRKTGSVVLSNTPVSDQVHSLRDMRSLLDFAASTVLDIKYEGWISNVSAAVTGYDEAAEGRWLRVAGVRFWKARTEPLCWSSVIIPEEFAPGPRGARATDKPLYQIVMETRGVKFGYVEQDISAVELPERLATLLQAQPNSAALLVKRRYVSNAGATFEISHNYYPSGRYAVRSVIRQRE